MGIRFRGPVRSPRPLQGANSLSVPLRQARRFCHCASLCLELQLKHAVLHGCIHRSVFQHGTQHEPRFLTYPPTVAPPDEVDDDDLPSRHHVPSFTTPQFPGSQHQTGSHLRSVYRPPHSTQRRSLLRWYTVCPRLQPHTTLSLFRHLRRSFLWKQPTQRIGRVVGVGNTDRVGLYD